MKIQFEMIKIFLFLLLIFPTLSLRVFVFHFENWAFQRWHNMVKFLGRRKEKMDLQKAAPALAKIVLRVSKLPHYSQRNIEKSRHTMCFKTALWQLKAQIELMQCSCDWLRSVARFILWSDSPGWRTAAFPSCSLNNHHAAGFVSAVLTCNLYVLYLVTVDVVELLGVLTLLRCTSNCLRLFFSFQHEDACVQAGADTNQISLFTVNCSRSAGCI